MQYLPNWKMFEVIAIVHCFNIDIAKWDIFSSVLPYASYSWIVSWVATLHMLLHGNFLYYGRNSHDIWWHCISYLIAWLVFNLGCILWALIAKLFVTAISLKNIVCPNLNVTSCFPIGISVLFENIMTAAKASQLKGNAN